MTTPVVTTVRLTGAAHRERLPLLVLGPSWGAAATALWAGCARHLADLADVVAWDLPGHGHNRAAWEDGTTPADLARGLLAVVDDVLAQRGDPGGPVDHVGVGLGGEVGVQLQLDAPGRVRTALVLGEPVAEPEELAARIRREVYGEEPPGVSADGTPSLDPRSRLLVSLTAHGVRGDVDAVVALLPEARATLTPGDLAACLAQATHHLDPTTAAAVLRAAAH